MQRLSLGEKWLIYNGDDEDSPVFSVKKHVTLLRSKALAHVTTCRLGGAGSYTIEGSYTQRKCAIYDGLSRRVAEVRRKEAAGGVTLGGDVFQLAVQPGLDLGLAMAVVIVLGQMYDS